MLWQGVPGRVIALAGEDEVRLFTSRVLLDELDATLAKNKLAKYVAATGLSIGQLLIGYRSITTLVSARQLGQPVSRDADDDAVLACARAARVELVVTGDNDLLVLGSFQGIRIVMPIEAVEQFHAAD